MNTKSTIVFLMISFFSCQAFPLDFGYNLISINKISDKSYRHNIVDDLYDNGQNNAIHRLKKSGSSYVRIFLDERFYIDSGDNFVADDAYVKKAAHVIKKFTDNDINVVVTFGYWIPKFFLDHAGYRSICGVNDVFYADAYSSMWGEYIASFVGNKHLSGLRYIVDIRNETYVDTNTKCGLMDLREKFIENTNSIVNKIKEKNADILVSMSVFCPMNVGRSKNFSPSRSGDNRNPVPVSWLANTKIDYIDLHVYYGGWAGNGPDEYLNGCIDGDINKKLFIGEIGFNKRYFNKYGRKEYKNDIKILIKKINPEFFLLWSMVNSGEDVMEFLDVGDVFHEN